MPLQLRLWKDIWRPRYNQVVPEIECDQGSCAPTVAPLKSSKRWQTTAYHHYLLPNSFWSVPSLLCSHESHSRKEEFTLSTKPNRSIENIYPLECRGLWLCLVKTDVLPSVWTLKQGPSRARKSPCPPLEYPSRGNMYIQKYVLFGGFCLFVVIWEMQNLRSNPDKNPQHTRNRRELP